MRGEFAWEYARSPPGPCLSPWSGLAGNLDLPVDDLLLVVVELGLDVVDLAAGGLAEYRQAQVEMIAGPVFLRHGELAAEAGAGAD